MATKKSQPEPNPAQPADAEGNIVRFTAGPQLWAYLDWLSRNTILGDTPGKVAQQVLVQRLSEMKGEDFKKPERT